MNMKFAVLCDLHLPFLQNTAQYAALDWAIGEIQRQVPMAVAVVGDITAYGEIASMEHFVKKMKSLPHPKLILSGNSDIRQEKTREAILAHTKSDSLQIGDTTLVGLCVHDRIVTHEDRKLLSSLTGKIILFLHYDMHSLEEDSLEFLETWAETRDVHIIHGHRHADSETECRGTKITGLRCLDPDKTKGQPPCIYFFTVEEDGTLTKEEVCFTFPSDNLKDLKALIGFSCFRPKTDIPYAAEHGIKAIEVRKFGGQYGSFSEISALCEDFREKGGQYISLHLPTIGWQNGEVTGKTDFLEAIEFAKLLRADGLTLHAPRVRKDEMLPDSIPWKAVLRTISEGLKALPEGVTLGIENVHLNPGEKDDGTRFFGCAPEECLAFMQAVRECCGKKNIGITLDTGHVRSNGSIGHQYTSGVWYEMVGRETVAYHVHQRKFLDGKRRNHTAISNWYGGEISYASFFWAWQAGKLNHKPMFLEMKNLENCIESYAVLEKIREVSGIDV